MYLKYMEIGVGKVLFALNQNILKEFFEINENSSSKAQCKPLYQNTK